MTCVQAKNLVVKGFRFLNVRTCVDYILNSRVSSSQNKSWQDCFENSSKQSIKNNIYI